MILALWDNGTHHRSKPRRGFLVTKPRLEVHRFPGDLLELNPDRWVWSHLRRHMLGSYTQPDVRELRRGVRLSVMRMLVRPKLIRSFAQASYLYD